jgi:hypothetical protein
MASHRRRVNDDRRRIFGSEPQRRVAFVCECGDVRCRRAVLLTVTEFDQARASGRPVVVDQSHEPPDARISTG